MIKKIEVEFQQKREGKFVILEINFDTNNKMEQYEYYTIVDILNVLNKNEVRENVE